MADRGRGAARIADPLAASQPEFYETEAEYEAYVRERDGDDYERELTHEEYYSDGYDDGRSNE